MYKLSFVEQKGLPTMRKREWGQPLPAALRSL